MAGKSGKSQVIKIGSKSTPNVPEELFGVSTITGPTQTAPDINVTSLGDTNQTHAKGIPDAALSLKGFHIAETAARLQELVTVDDDVAVEYFPEGEGIGKPVWTGRFTVQTYEPEGAVDGALTFSSNLLPVGAVEESSSGSS